MGTGTCSTRRAGISPGSYYKKFPVVLWIRADAPLAVEIPVLVTDKDGYDLSGEILKTPTREQFREYMASNRLFRYRKHVKRGPTLLCKHCSGSGKMNYDTFSVRRSYQECDECIEHRRFGITHFVSLPSPFLSRHRYSLLSIPCTLQSRMHTMSTFHSFSFFSHSGLPRMNRGI